MDLPIYIVDAFTEVPFRGNPAGVCICPSDLDDRCRQSIANELNLSETAFVEDRGDSNYGLRWFTPTHEVSLCGHATLASAHILWTERSASPKLMFHSLSGILTTRHSGGDIEMDFPSEFVAPSCKVEEFSAALGKTPSFIGEGESFWLCELESESAVRKLEPSLSLIASMGKTGLIVTAISDSEAEDFVSRVFAPCVGVPEDPVTGSAHCVLAPYWAQKLGKTKLVGYQASKRGGHVKLDFLGARTLLIGKAHTVLRGTISTVLTSFA
jgi:PhzF family phenazine biosynthesis protein